MVSPGRPYWLGAHASRLVNSTNLSIRPPLYAFCSAVYSWSWSQVTACIGDRRAGWAEFGLFGASRPAWTRVLMSLGVSSDGLKAAAGVPEPCWVSAAVFAAWG